MSLNLVKKNTSSPFHLQRSIVPQEGGAYQDGGYNPNALYNNDAANKAIESFSKSIGSALSNMGSKKDPEPEVKEDTAGKEAKIENAKKTINNVFDPLGVKSAIDNAKQSAEFNKRIEDRKIASYRRNANKGDESFGID